MEQQYPWAQVFNINAEEIASFLQQAKGTNLLEFLLRNQKIPEDQYLQWAKNHYGIAAIKNSFFQQSMNPMLMQKYIPLNLWGPSLLAVMEYDNIVYIACISPPDQATDTKIKQLIPTAKYLLAPLSGIEKWWSIIVPMQQQIHTQSIPTPHSNQQQHLPSNSTTNKVPQDSTQEASTKLPSTQNIATTESHHKLNLNLNTSNTQTPPSSEQPEALEVPNIETPTSDAPLGLDLSINTEEGNTSASPFEQLSQEVKSNASKSSEIFNFNTSTTTPSATNKNIHNTGIYSTSVPIADSQATAKTPPLTPTAPIEQITHTTAPSNSKNSTGPEQTILPVNNTEEIQSVEQLPAFVFSKILYLKDKMFLLKEGPVLTPYKWDGNWTPSQTKIDLNLPSVFRIVSNSRAAYHGYIVENPINKHFFDSYYDGRIPEHLSIFPIIHNSEVLAMFLGAGNKNEGEKTNWKSLQQLGENLGSILQKLAKAA